MKKVNSFKIKKLVAVIVTSLLGISSVYAAQTPIYARGSVGVSIPSDLGYDLGTNTELNVGLKVAPQYAVAVGFQPDFWSWNDFSARAEGEITYRQNDTDKIKLGQNNLINPGGEMSVATFMANAFIDFDNVQYVQPFIGAGLGAALVGEDVLYSPAGANTAINQINDSNTVFAAQVMAGLSYSLNNNLSFLIDAKYLTTAEFESKRTVNGQNVSLAKGNYDETSVNFGVKYNF